MNPTANSTARAAWIQALIPLALLMATIVGLYWGTAVGMVTIWWRSETFTHAFLVPPMVLWLAWRQRDQLLTIAPRPAWWVLAPMLAVAFIWLLGQLVAVNAVTQLSLVALLVLAVPLVLGMEVAKALMFPLAFAFFAVPIGEFAMPWLMQGTADFTIAALRLSGIPVYREGLKFVIPSGSWSVVEACSGVRYLIASFMVGSLFAYLNYQSNRRRWIFVGLSLVVPIFANWLRAYGIVMLGHLSDNKLATGVDHLIYGWVFFGVVIMALFAIGARWTEPEASAPTLDQTADRTLFTAAGTPKAVWMVAIAAAMVVVLPVAGKSWLDVGPGRNATVPLSLPASAAAGWTSRPLTAQDWTPQFVNPTSTASQQYGLSGGAKVGLHLIYYRQQRDDSKLVTSVNQVVSANDKVWNAVTTESRAIGTDANGTTVVAREHLLLGQTRAGQSEKDRLKVWMLYWVDGRWTASDALAKIQGAFGKLAGRGDDGAAVFLSVQDSQPGGAQAAAEKFWADNRSFIEKRLLEARADTH